jgi:hypothetical protein
MAGEKTMTEIIHLYVPYEINPNGAQGTFVTPFLPK